MSRYYPGFLAALFIVLLRIAIGWHFFHEGLEKVGSTYGGKEPFSAEILNVYLLPFVRPLMTVVVPVPGMSVGGCATPPRYGVTM